MSEHPYRSYSNQPPPSYHNTSSNRPPSSRPPGTQAQHPSFQHPQLLSQSPPSQYQEYSSPYYAPQQQQPTQSYSYPQSGPQQSPGFPQYSQSQGLHSPPFGSSSSPHTGSFVPMDPAYPLAAQMGLQLGTQAFSAGQDFVHKQTWQRQIYRSEVTGQIGGFKPPSQDINAPDLYIPSMAIVTYILLVGLVYGTRNAFRPELLGYTASKATIFIAIELLLVKVGGYLLGVSADISLFDIMSVIGYNYVALIFSLLAELLAGWIAKYVVFSYCSLAMAFFLLRCLRHAVLPENDPQLSLVPEHRRRRINFLFIIVAAQLVASFFLLI